MNNVAFEVNQYTPRIRFLASLSDGRTIIQDDIPGELPAWRRLKDFITETKLKITCLRLQSPNIHKPGDIIEVVMPANQMGYCFGKKRQAVFPMGGQAEFIGIGFYNGETANLQWFNVNNFNDRHSDTRSKEKAGFFLILNDE